MMSAPSRKETIRLVGLCGSLRAVSVHRALLQAAQASLPEGVSLAIFEGLAGLPPFNPDVEGTPAEPAEVLNFRTGLREADGVLVASPEYAHGVPGALKNALDWTVGSGEFSGKPVAVLNASPSSFHAWNALMEIIRTMDARLIEEASVRIPLPTNKITTAEILAAPSLKQALADALSVLALSIKKDQVSIR